MRSEVRMLTISVMVICACLFVCGCEQSDPPAADGRTLEDAVRANLEWSKFDKTKLEDHSVVLVASGAGRHFFTSEDIVAFHADVQKTNRIYQTSGFKVLEKNQTSGSRFGSITYEITWSVSSGGNTKSVRLVCREIWERQIDGWHRLFAALD